MTPLLSTIALFTLTTGTPAIADQAVRFSLLSTGAGKKIGYYGPQKLDLSTERPATITRLPEGLESSPHLLFTKLNISAWGNPEANFHVVIEEPEGRSGEPEPGSFRLWIDANGNGDLTDDPTVEWKGRYGKTDDELTFMTYQGVAPVNLGTEAEPYPAGVRLYRFDKTDARRTQTRDSIMYYRDYATEGTLTLLGRSFRAMLADEGCRGDFRGRTAEPGQPPLPHSGVSILIDVNDNGRFDNRGEVFDSHKPFNIGGITYELADITRDGLSFRVVVSSQSVPEIPPPPDHTPGKPITPFEGLLMDGTTVRFPGDYKGKVVLLDFWATWCGPCLAEVPHIVAAYEKHRGAGFEVLGITLDSKDMADKITATAADKGMTWPQVYSAMGWKDPVAQTYVVQGIPAAFLVDGDTGKILAEGGDLRHPRFTETIDRVMAERAVPKPRPRPTREPWAPIMGGE
ncbi:MAG: TlpA family protein disulfide reductase [Phycisphaerales bacterium]